MQVLQRPAWLLQTPLQMLQWVPKRLRNPSPHLHPTKKLFPDTLRDQLRTTEEVNGPRQDRQTVRESFLSVGIHLRLVAAAYARVDRHRSRS
jgi:hypothetical protein